jgi:hypothetical protein
VGGVVEQREVKWDVCGRRAEIGVEKNDDDDGRIQGGSVEG